MRQGRTIVPAGLILFVALLGAGGPGAPAAHEPAWLDDRFGQPIAPIYLLLRPDVQADLQLNPHQIAGARELVSRLIERLLVVKNKAVQDAMSEKRAIDEAMAAWLRHELSEAQLERLTQISFQWEGTSAMRRPSVARFLVLAEPQRQSIERLLANRDRRQSAGSMSAAEFDRFSKEVVAVLNPLQKQQWDSLLGPPCRFAIGHPAGAASRDASAGEWLTGQPRPPGR